MGCTVLEAALRATVTELLRVSLTQLIPKKSGEAFSRYSQM
jgi:hypothetical protein